MVPCDRMGKRRVRLEGDAKLLSVYFRNSSAHELTFERRIEGLRTMEFNRLGLHRRCGASLIIHCLIPLRPGSLVSSSSPKRTTSKAPRP